MSLTGLKIGIGNLYHEETVTSTPYSWTATANAWVRVYFNTNQNTGYHLASVDSKVITSSVAGNGSVFPIAKGSVLTVSATAEYGAAVSIWWNK